MKNRSIKILIISDTITNISYTDDNIGNIDYSIQVEFCTKDLNGIEAKCDDEFDIIISETYDFTHLKQKHGTLNDNVCKNFFGFRGRFVLLNCYIDESQIRDYDTAFFPNCKTFKRKEYTKQTKWERFKDIFSDNGLKIWTKIKSFSCAKYSEKEIQNDTNFLLFLKKEVKKYIAVEKDYFFSWSLFKLYIRSWKRSHRILLQGLVLLLVFLLFVIDCDFTSKIKIDINRVAPFYGSHLFKPNIYSIIPLSIIITIITCFFYWVWYVRDLFEIINKEVKPIAFKVLYYGTAPLIFIILTFLLLKLFEMQIKLFNIPIYDYEKDYFFFKDWIIIGLFTILDCVILVASYFSFSKNKLITKATQTKLQNIYDLTFQTILFCDIPILLGTILLTVLEKHLFNDSIALTTFQIGVTGSSLFILQLIYFFINWKSSYEDYLSS